MVLSSLILTILQPLYIVWQPDEIAFHLGPLAIRWYSLCWLLGLVLAYFMVRWLYKDQKIKDELFDPLFIYCFLGILIGARLGHCLFYEPEYWLSSWQHILEIFIPVRITADGSWNFTGYAGLASHGGTLGLMIALWLYRQHCHCHTYHRMLHPTGQPDEFRNRGKGDGCTLGFSLCQRRSCHCRRATASGTAL